MSFSSGTFSINSSGQPVVTGTVISSTAFNALTADLATGLSTCVLKDGTQTLTANIPMAGYILTGLGAGSATGNSLRYEQLFTAGTVTLLGALTTPGNISTSGSGTITAAGNLTASAHTVFEGVTSTGATGTGKLVYDGTPTLVTAVLGSSTATTQSAGDNSTKVATTAYADTTNVTLGTAQASTSGTSILFTGIPSWAKRVTISLIAVSTNGTAGIRFRLGPSGGVETSGYVGIAWYVGNTTADAAAVSSGFDITAPAANTDTLSGVITLTLENASSNTWTANGMFYNNGTNKWCYASAGYKPLAGTMDRVSVTTTNGSDAFDAGEINISYQ